MAIDKALYGAPMGLGALDEEPIEIEVVDPEEMSISMPGFSMHMEKSDYEGEFEANLAEEMAESHLAEISGELLGDYDADLQSRKEWLDTYVKGLKLLGLKYEERSEPWSGACGVFHPLLMESAIKFQSETIMETFPAGGPVRTRIIGRETPEKLAAAKRVEEDMNYQLTEVMQEYRPEHERMLLAVALSGNAFKKIYFDPSLDRQTAMFISAEDIVVPYGAASLESAERVTHRMRKTKNELRKLQVAGFYRDVDLGEPQHVLDEVEKQKAQDQGFSASSDDRFQILEMHVDMDLEGYEDKDKKGAPTGIALPYIVTIEKGTGTVLAIRRNWLPDDRLKHRRQHFVHYGYIPGFGFYYFGLIHLIGGHTQAATSLLRQLVDAGTLSNLPGGLKSRGLRIKGDDTPIAPGEFRDVDLPSGSIRDNILPLPYKEPSQTLAALMDRIVVEGKQFAAAGDLKISDMSAQAPVGTTLAVLERALKVMSAVQARIHYAMKQEFKLLAAIIRDTAPDSYNYEPDVGDAAAKKSDYDQVDVIPVSDPNSSTLAQRVVQYQAVMQLAQTAPDIYDLPALHRQMIEVLGVKNAAKLIPDEDDMKPLDPVSENMAIMRQKPVKAFLYQDHEAHLAVHMAAMQDPKIAAVVGQNPNAQAIMAAASEHIMEHVSFQYRKELEKQLGASLPPPPDFSGDDKELGHLPPEIEVQLSQLASQAAGRLLQKDQAEMQMQQAQQQMQDPLIQMQQMDLQIKKQLADLKAQQVQLEQQMKMQELQMQQQVRMQELDLKARELEMRERQAEAESERKQTKDILDSAARQDELELREKELEMRGELDMSKHELEGFRTGIEHMHRAQDREQRDEQSIRQMQSQERQRAAQQKQPQAKPKKEGK
jgi:hypothetical protein